MAKSKNKSAAEELKYIKEYFEQQIVFKRFSDSTTCEFISESDDGWEYYSCSANCLYCLIFCELFGCFAKGNYNFRLC